MIIRPEYIKDQQEIEQMILAAFKDHPHQDSEKGTIEHLIVNNLREADALSLSLVAELEGQLIGHVAFSRISINGQDLNWVVMAPVSVLPNYQNQRIGSQLIQEGLNRLLKSGTEGCIVIGDPKYYERFGFRHQHDLIVEGISSEYVMVKLFNTLGEPKGQVQFHSGFHIE
ncbi:GNAT family N-acetyltransferase [Ignatzschineria sp. LJL83]